jgi:Dockerin type I domain
MFLISIEAASFGVSSWDNVPITDPHTVIVKFTYFGDVNLDGQVNAHDYQILDQNYLNPASANSIITGDADLSGVVNAGVYAFLDQFYLLGVGNPLIASPNNPVSPSNVPEPASLGFIGLWASFLMRRRIKA